MKPKQHYVHSTKGNRQRIHIYGWKRTSEIFRWYAAFTNQQWEVVLDNQHKHLWNWLVQHSFWKLIN